MMGSLFEHPALDFGQWVTDTLQEENRIRRLDQQQRTLEIRPPQR